MVTFSSYTPKPSIAVLDAAARKAMAGRSDSDAFSCVLTVLCRLLEYPHVTPTDVRFSLSRIDTDERYRAVTKSQRQWRLAVRKALQARALRSFAPEDAARVAERIAHARKFVGHLLTEQNPDRPRLKPQAEVNARDALLIAGATITGTLLDEKSQNAVLMTGGWLAMQMGKSTTASKAAADAVKAGWLTRVGTANGTPRYRVAPLRSDAARATAAANEDLITALATGAFDSHEAAELIMTATHPAWSFGAEAGLSRRVFFRLLADMTAPSRSLAEGWCFGIVAGSGQKTFKALAGQGILALPNLATSQPLADQLDLAAANAGQAKAKLHEANIAKAAAKAELAAVAKTNYVNGGQWGRDLVAHFGGAPRITNLADPAQLTAVRVFATALRDAVLTSPLDVSGQAGVRNAVAYERK
ncbi:hypothetical protein [Mycetocola zhadangensis]|uniref:Uncharacterized protein n=1 Tax=Mycetocola zhadangensis TaxID=1164595 RepID=A0A3L7J638_9MICO|nr:hypothetical protein [Mycetocola zhadangensis]RLQ86178.1 hypothetical protein D9V28_04910 [Mycetocola zhadangensis]GGE89032.1 hypothetical protein GCM10011313_09660 [Mycetocola zhadangensis]